MKWFVCAIAIAAILATDLASAQSARPNGRDLALDPKRGNCIDCHRVPGDPGAATQASVGPPLANLRARYANAAALANAIADWRRQNPNTIMPPYGPHRILSEAELLAVAEYLLGQ